MQAKSGFDRRQWLLASLLAPLDSAWAESPGNTAMPELIKRPLVFPQDLGSHPDTAIEWWYVTGALQAQQRQYGFQLTFFRARVPGSQTMRSAFAAKQLFFAHAGVTDVSAKRLLYDQRIARSSGTGGVDLARASTSDTDVQLHDWSLLRQDGPDDHYLALAQGPDFGFALTLNQTQPLLLQGDQGLSRKGPQTTQASYYYSLPQLSVAGHLTLAGRTMPVAGRAWLDHEWSQALLHPEAVGWDWIGMNLTNGTALTAFRLRNKAGGTLWAGGSWRAHGATQAVKFAPDQVVMTPQRLWQSPTSQARYPVQWALELRHPVLTAETTPQQFSVQALVDNQELDSQRSTGAMYWEGLSALLGPQGQVLGHGYLEMTGYASPLRL